jgi:two-component system nitrate/nitrite response regulator NarP
MARVLIADDHPVVLAGVEAILRDTSYKVVAAARNGADVLETLPSARPDILVLDVHMPERTGLDVARTLRARGDNRPIVLLTASLDDRKLLDAVEIGVDGIVLKEGAEHLLVRCLDSVSAGRRWIDHDLLQRALDLKTGEADAAGGLGTLSPRERAVAGLVAQGLRNREIAGELGITEGTVKLHLHRIYEKLGVGNRTELAIRARQFG